MTQMKGIYALLIELPESEEISVGRLGPIAFPRGFYAYVGSALNGIEPRVNYHLRKNKKPRWHIDYLLGEASIKRIVLYETEGRLECILAQALSKEFPSIPGFGSSDCKCQSHLYFECGSAKLEEETVKAIELPARVMSPDNFLSSSGCGRIGGRSELNLSHAWFILLHRKGALISNPHQERRSIRPTWG